MSASLLAIDLARHPSGAATADVTERVLSLRADDLAALATCTPAPGEVRERVLAACADGPRMSTLMGGVAATVADGLPSPVLARTLVDAMAETLLGGLADLLGLLEREEPLAGADPVARQVALDAVTAAWAGRQADLDDLHRLRAPWADALPPFPPSVPEQPWSAELRTLLDEVGRRTPEQWRRTCEAHDAHRGGLRWSNAVHASCAAAHEQDRLHDVARAQLAAARALRLSGASTGPDAHAVGMAVTAAVQAVCTADVLPDDVTHALRSAWVAGH